MKMKKLTAVSFALFLSVVALFAGPTLPAGKSVTVTTSTGPAAGSTQQGDQAVTLIFSSSGVGTVNGKAITNAAIPIEIRANYPDYLPVINYSVTSGTVLCVEVK
jgi:hypothetical protein